jgi:RNA polymerase sigma factor (sigma-70 family)
MLAPAFRLKEPSFRECIANYVAVKCRRHRVPPVDVDDIKQEALAQIVAKVGTFQPEKSEFEQWARGIAWNVIREYLRKAKLYFATFTEYHSSVYDYAAQDPSPELCARQNQARCAIEQAAKGIRPKQVQVLDLHVVDEMTHGEIGAALNMSADASEKCFQRVCNRMAACIAGDILSTMPPFVSGCEQPMPTSELGSRRPELSHYAGQFATAIAAVIAAFLMLITSKEPLPLHAMTIGKIGTTGIVQSALYQLDKPPYVPDEPMVYPDAPNVKPDPASLRSVRDVSTPTRTADKPTYVQDLAPLPPYKHTPDAFDHRLPGL